MFKNMFGWVISVIVIEGSTKLESRYWISNITGLQREQGKQSRLAIYTLQSFLGKQLAPLPSHSPQLSSWRDRTVPKVAPISEPALAQLMEGLAGSGAIEIGVLRSLCTEFC